MIHLLFYMLEAEHRALSVLDKHSVIQLYPQPWTFQIGSLKLFMEKRFTEIPKSNNLEQEKIKMIFIHFPSVCQETSSIPTYFKILIGSMLGNKEKKDNRKNLDLYNWVPQHYPYEI